MKPIRPIYRTVFTSPLGPMSLLADDDALLGAYFVGQKHFEKGFKETPVISTINPPLSQALSWLDAYFKGEMAELPALAPLGTPFQTRVWALLSEIPKGETVTYGQLARSLNCQSAQAIGGAVGRNPLSLFIPCHRVLGASGQLTGYAGGLDKKIWLLNHEQAWCDSPLCDFTTEMRTLC
ncbi:methylated-DNA--[protein]-cysteine S-methyltransferase [Streptococcus moroccensis]|uniref:Methylated-DNA--protein-cysteine methyltransferase n=2 Tax=Streptococcus moroccensis TaxID=1451356 RepID=A0ABT9YQQ3_9STRE|nr:methylated-DNA-[protein]-cysteine S-methyltransferase [Streptococcus moroccensis]